MPVRCRIHSTALGVSRGGGLVGWPSTSVGVLWAVISTVFVYKDTRTHSLSAGISRLIATFASFALCLIYLSLFPATTIGMGALIAIGVGLDTVKQIESQLMQRNYEGFLK